jgi:hypothetical protein
VADTDEREDDSEYHDSRPRTRRAPSVIFKSEPDFILRLLMGGVVTLLTFILWAVYTGNREQGETRTELRAYVEATDRRIDSLENATDRRLTVLENIVQRWMLEGRQ